MKRFLVGGVLLLALLASMISTKLRVIRIDPPTVNASQKPTPAEVRAYIAAQASSTGVNIQKALWIVSHESQDGRNMRGDDGQSRGYWQISNVWHPEVPDSCTDNLKCSTAWSLAQIKAGHIGEWSTYRLCRRLYADCPF